MTNTERNGFVKLFYNIWKCLVSFFSRNHSETNTGICDKCFDARKKISIARKEYLKKMLDDEEKERINDADKKDSLYQSSVSKKRPSNISELDIKAMEVNPIDYDYPFENIVFEGGGLKGVAFCGSIQVLEELGIYSKIKRFAGASAGAIKAALISVGYNSEETEDFLQQDMIKLFFDGRFGIFSLLPNLLSGFGWHPGNRILKALGEAIASKTNGNPDLTFAELYDLYGKELCIVVTNLNHMTEEYCHVKTTPNMPIRLAVRMSMSLPGVFKATKYTLNKETNTYVDGGLLCNYPIHCFDEFVIDDIFKGWWLSMKPEDGYLDRLQPLEAIPSLLERKSRFAYDPKTNKTLGVTVFSDYESGVFRYALEKRLGVHLDKFPDTKLARKVSQKKNCQETTQQEYHRVTKAVNAFLKVLKKHNIDGDEVIDREEFINAFQDDELNKVHSNLLFGEHCSAELAFDAIDKDGNGEIEFSELKEFIENSGICLQQRFLGYQRQEITGLFSFFNVLQDALLLNVKKAFVAAEDLDRTVGINTGHVGTMDFQLEPEDRAYAIEQGRRSMLSFLKYYAASKNLKKCQRFESISEEGSNTKDIQHTDPSFVCIDSFPEDDTCFLESRKMKI
ncbi:uncharacterized protein LOC134684480 isoform X2 [Mytilus trossulus]|uniref:uncharacterized protein LOC134684480 isoform X2 n=1 Tax=Mytilus trossulus TaxID=6551 RepID=UPI003007F0AA